MHEKILFISYDDFLSNKYWFDVGNTGNMLFSMATFSYLYSDDIDCTFITFAEASKIAQTNKTYFQSFDKVITNTANIFCTRHIENMQKEVELFSAINRPIYILGAGAQSDKDYSFSFLTNIKDYVKKYMDTLLGLGGTITLRGNFTKKVLESLGYKNLFVSGCPSMYFNGENFHIDKSTMNSEGGGGLKVCL